MHVLDLIRWYAVFKCPLVNIVFTPGDKCLWAIVIHHQETHLPHNGLLSVYHEVTAT
jgi:hypothetical protein